MSTITPLSLLFSGEEKDVAKEKRGTNEKSVHFVRHGEGVEEGRQPPAAVLHSPHHQQDGEGLEDVVGGSADTRPGG